MIGRLTDCHQPDRLAALEAAALMGSAASLVMSPPGIEGLLPFRPSQNLR